MNLLRISIIPLIVFLAFSSAESKSDSLGVKPTIFWGSYFSENFALPGYCLNVEKTLRIHGRNSFALDAGTGGVFANPFYDAYFLSLGLSGRHNYLNNMFVDISCNIGYQHLFNAQKTYAVENSRIVEQPNYGYPMAMLYVPLGIGYNFQPVLKIPLQLRLAAGVVVEYPTNWWVMTHWAYQIGIGIPLPLGGHR
jgi:hypothetical protein